MMKSMLDDLGLIFNRQFPDQPVVISHADILHDEPKPKIYRTLMSRQKCQSLEQRVNVIEAKRRKLTLK